MLALANDFIAVNKDMAASGLLSRSLLDKGGSNWQDGPLTTVERLGAIRYLDEESDIIPFNKK